MAAMYLVSLYACLLWGASSVRVSVSDLEGSEVMFSRHDSHAPSSGATSSAFDDALRVAMKVKNLALQSGGFVFERGSSGFHILFDPEGSTMNGYFETIRKELAKGSKGNIGTKLKQAMKSGAITAQSNNKDIWEALIKSLEFSGVDFEHRYGLVKGGDQPAEWEYVFQESLVLTQTVLLVVTEQSYGPISPGLKNARLWRPAQPLLVVGMIGDCVKERSTFYQSLTDAQKDIVNSPTRLAHKMKALTSSLLSARSDSDFPGGLVMDATVPGAGAFGGKIEKLAKPFVNSIQGLEWTEKDEVNFFIFNPDMKAVFGLQGKDPFPYPSAPGRQTHRNIKIRSSPGDNGGNYDMGVGLGGLGRGPKKLRVVIAGFDPISLVPHTVVNRAYSLEGQLGHATDMMFRLTGKEGIHVGVQVTKGQAHKSGKDFHTKTGQTISDGPYPSVRFVQKDLMEVAQKYELHDKLGGPRVWNGDRWDGWQLKAGRSVIPDWVGARRIGWTAL